MMAYLNKLSIKCNDYTCRSAATVQLVDWINERRGRYCARHGKAALRERQAFEDTHNRDGSTREARKP